MSARQTQVIMIGAFPPPVHGVSTVNATVRSRLLDLGVSVGTHDIAPKGLNRSWLTRLSRLPKVLYELMRFGIARRNPGNTFYLSVSGGNGKLYDIAFVILARLKGLNLYLHHHSFAYLQCRDLTASVLVRVAGAGAVHITLSPNMKANLQRIYGACHVEEVSNAVLLLPNLSEQPTRRKGVSTIGFLSNVCEEKGVFDFLDLALLLWEKNIPISARLAGPFLSAKIEQTVCHRLSSIPNVEYVGPMYGDDKQKFLEGIDVLVFPTRYVNEADPIVNHEAMRCGVPVIAYGRGCIPEILSSESGLVIDPSEPFVHAAFDQIKSWYLDQAGYESASVGAMNRFLATYTASRRQWEHLLKAIAGSGPTII